MYGVSTAAHEGTLRRLAELYRAIEEYREALRVLRIMTPTANLDYYMNLARAELRHYGK